MLKIGKIKIKQDEDRAGAVKRQVFVEYEKSRPDGKIDSFTVSTWERGGSGPLCGAFCARRRRE